MALLAPACRLWGVITEYRPAKNGLLVAYNMLKTVKMILSILKEYIVTFDNKHLLQHVENHEQ